MQNIIEDNLFIEEIIDQLISSNTSLNSSQEGGCGSVHCACI